MAILIAGGGGFIGAHLARRLVQMGEQVVIFDLSPNWGLVRDIAGQVKIVQGDATQMVDILHALREYGVRDVYHLIALLANVSQEKPLLALKVNVETLLNFLEAARIANLNRVVFASSVAVYDPREPSPVKETAPLRPASVYGATKVLGEFYGLHYHKTYGIDFRVLRFTTLYGLGKSGGSTGICSQMIEKSARGEPVQGDVAEAVTDWLYIKDAVNSLLLARQAENPKQRIYNIGGSSHSVREVVQVVKKFIPGASIQMEAKKVFPWPPAYDYSKAQEELGYKPTYALQEGVRDFIEEAKK
jgi:UDP-glucose 4-epimerase